MNVAEKETKGFKMFAEHSMFKESNLLTLSIGVGSLVTALSLFNYYTMPTFPTDAQRGALLPQGNVKVNLDSAPLDADQQVLNNISNKKGYWFSGLP